MRALRAIVGVILPLAVASLGLLVSTPQAVAGPTSASNFLASCAESANTVSALFVLDRSGSLVQTDPTGIRYDALQIALEQLAHMKPSGSHALAIEAAVASFDDSYDSVQSVVRWTRLDANAFNGNASKQQDTIDNVIQLVKAGTAPRGETDFEVALTGVLADMSDRGGPGSCRVVFWFTDGTFYIGGGEQTASDRMCQQGGLLDQIRQAGIVLVGIQLAADSRYLWPMSEGQDQSGHTCGTVPIPPDWAPGLYIRADDTAALKRIFGSVVDIIQGCTPADASTKLIDPGVRRFRVTIETPSHATALRLDAPDGTVISAALSGTTQVAGYEVMVQSDDYYVSFEVKLPPGGGAGNWMFSTDPATTSANTSMCVFHDLHFELADPQQQIPAGTKAEILVNAVDPDGVATDLTVFGDAAVGASAVGPDGKIRPAAATIRNGQVVVLLDSQPDDARIELSLAMNLTTQSGLALAPVSGRLPIVLTLPKEFPVVRPSDQLDLGTAVKVKPTSAILTLMGSTEGPTKVCFGTFTDVVVPQNAIGTVPEISDQCVELKISQSYNVTVSVKPTAAAEGAGSASLPITLYSAATATRPTQEIHYDLPVVWRFSDPLNAPVALAVLVIIGLISVLLPLLAMGLANIVSAKFDVKDLQAGEVFVTVADGSVRRSETNTNESRQVIDVYQDRATGISVTNPRHFTLFGIEFRAKGTLNPFGAPKFTASAPPGYRILSSVGFPIPGDRQANVSPGLGFIVLAIVADKDLASTSRDVPCRLVFLMRYNESFEDRSFADRLMNKSMLWEKISDDWRPTLEERIDRNRDSNTDHTAIGGTSPRIPDDPYFD